MKRLFSFMLICLFSLPLATTALAGGDYDPKDYEYSIWFYTPDGSRSTISPFNASSLKEGVLQDVITKGDMSYGIRETTIPDGTKGKWWVLTMDNIEIRQELNSPFISAEWTQDNGALLIELIGDNVIENTSPYGGVLFEMINAYIDGGKWANVIFFGDGTLTLKTKNTEAIKLTEKTTIQIWNTTVSIESSNGTGIGASESESTYLYLKNCDLTINAGYSAIDGVYSVVLQDTEFKDGKKYDAEQHVLLDRNGNRATTCKTGIPVKSYNISINDVELTEESIDDFNGGKIDNFTGKVEIVDLGSGEYSDIYIKFIDVKCKSVSINEGKNPKLLFEGDNEIKSTESGSIGLKLNYGAGVSLKGLKDSRLTIEAQRADVYIERKYFTNGTVAIYGNLNLVINGGAMTTGFITMSGKEDKDNDPGEVSVFEQARVEINLYTPTFNTKWNLYHDIGIASLAYFDEKELKFCKWNGEYFSSNDQLVLEPVESTGFVFKNVALNNRTVELFDASIMRGVSVKDERLVLDNAEINGCLETTGRLYSRIEVKNVSTINGDEYALLTNTETDVRDLYIWGDGILRLSAKEAGIQVCNGGDVSISDATVILKSGKRGIVAQKQNEGTLSLSNANLTINCNADEPTICSFNQLELIDTRLVNPEGGRYDLTDKFSEGKVLLNKEGAVARGKAQFVPHWGIKINGVEVTAENAANIDAGQTAGTISCSYDSDQGAQLTLKDVVLNGKTGIECETNKITVFYEGDNTITSESDAIVYNGNGRLQFSTNPLESHTLTLNAANGAGIRVNKGVCTIYYSTLNIKAKEGIVGAGGAKGEELSISTSTITVEATDLCVGNFSDILIDGAAIIQPEYASVYDGTVVDIMYEPIKGTTLMIGLDFDIQINGKPITVGDNQNVGQTRGTISFNKIGQLTLDNVELSGTKGIEIRKAAAGIIIKTKGNTHIAVSGSNAIVLGSDMAGTLVEIHSKGSLLVEGKNALEVDNAGVRFSGENITLSGEQSAIVGSESAIKGEIKVEENTSLTLKGANRTPVYNIADVTADPEMVAIKPEGAEFNTSVGCYQIDGVTVKEDIVFSPLRYVEIGDLRLEGTALLADGTVLFTGDAADYIKSGSVKFDAATATLTLNNAELTKPIFSTYPALTISLEGNNIISSTGSYALIRAESCDLTIGGTGSLILKGNNHGIEALNLTIMNTAVSIDGVEIGIELYLTDYDDILSLVFNNATVDISASTAAVEAASATTPKITYTACQLKEPKSAEWGILGDMILYKVFALMNDGKMVTTLSVAPNKTDLSETLLPAQPKAQKLLINGQVVILLPDGSIYNLQGIRIK